MYAYFPLDLHECKFTLPCSIFSFSNNHSVCILTIFNTIQISVCIQITRVCILTNYRVIDRSGLISREVSRFLMVVDMYIFRYIDIFLLKLTFFRSRPHSVLALIFKLFTYQPPGHIPLELSVHMNISILAIYLVIQYFYLYADMSSISVKL